VRPWRTKSECADEAGKLPYTEGSVFLVPLQGSGYARGVVARASKRGRVLFGYFFGPRLVSEAGMLMDDLTPEAAILRGRFGDLGLIEGTWMIYGMVPNWDRAAWPMPDFIHTEPIANRTWCVRYSDYDPQEVESETRCQLHPDLLPNIMSGAEAIEIKLTKLLE
jgi:hypothetical protein